MLFEILYHSMNDKNMESGLIITAIIFLVLINISSNTTTFAQTKKTVTSDEMSGMENKENTSMLNGFSPSNPHPNASQPMIASTQNLSFSRLEQNGSPVFGNTSAPITIVQFGDFQCHFCGRFARDTEPQINQTYIETGKTNLVFKHFVTHGSDSMTAAIASQCANEQGKFWSFYKILYGNQGEENSGWASADNLKKFVSQIPAMDIKKFDSCLDSQKYKSIAESDTAFAYKSGFQGTPTFIIEKSDGSDPQILLGAYPFPAFQAIIDKKISGG
jgi:protein-disulfide isomerase